MPFSDDKVKAIDALKGIHGVGDDKAMKLYKAGYKTVQDVREKEGGLDQLSYVSRVAIKYYEDLQHKIPASEVKQIAKQVDLANQELFDGALEVQAVGSYRRGKTLCGDADILITCKDGSVEAEEAIVYITADLEEKGLLKDRLGADKVAKTGSRTYTGVCKLDKKDAIHRRIDIKFFPANQYGFALMYFTGSAQFNIAMRKRAIERGFTLSEAELVVNDPKRARDWVPNSPMNMLRTKTSVSEADIFKAFDLPFIKPADREPERFTKFLK